MAAVQFFLGVQDYVATRIDDHAERTRLTARGYLELERVESRQVLARAPAHVRRRLGELGGSEAWADAARGLIFLRAPCPMLGATSESERGAERDQAGEPQQITQDQAWIEIALVDMDGEPVSGVEYLLTLPNGSVRRGTTNQHGLARYEGFSAGDCELSFVGLDEAMWTRA